MLFLRENGRLLPRSRLSPCLLQLQVAFIVFLLSLQLPSTSARRFEGISEKTGKVVVILDVEFTLQLDARKDGEVVESKKLTEMGIADVELHEIASRNFNFIDLVYKAGAGKEAGFLRYRFQKYDFPYVVGMGRDFDLSPKVMFPHVQSEIEHVRFSEPGKTEKNIGDPQKSFLCDIKETIVFQVDKAHSVESSDGYSYSAKLETRHFQAQAFNVKNGQFSPEPPTVCKPPASPSSDAARRLVVLVGSLTGGVSFVTVVAVVTVVLVVRQRRQRSLDTKYLIQRA